MQKGRIGLTVVKSVAYPFYLIARLLIKAVFVKFVVKIQRPILT